MIKYIKAYAARAARRGRAAPQPYADERRIGLDTGAYQTGVLTAACLDAGKVSFVRT